MCSTVNDIYCNNSLEIFLYQVGTNELSGRDKLRACSFLHCVHEKSNPLDNVR